jgi:Ca2+-binding EF-hand superfamily protein
MEVKLHPGTYVVLPRTLGAYLSRPVDSDPLPWIARGETFHPFVESTIKDVFRKFDLEINEGLSYNEFAMFLRVVGYGCSESDYNYLKS